MNGHSHGASASPDRVERQTDVVNRSGVRPSPVFLIIVAVAVAGGLVLTFVHSELGVDGGSLLLILGGWGVSLCLHEFGHALVAFRGGDYSIRDKGYLNLDIRRYTDPVFSIVMPLLLLAFGGIPLPGGAVWVNRHALRSKRVEAFVSAAGPLSNLVFGIILALVIMEIPVTNGDLLSLFDSAPTGKGALLAALSYLALLQIFAFIINILPIPGLDGWGILEPWMSPDAKRFGAMVRPWAPFVLFILLIGVPSVSQTVFDAVDHVFSWVGGSTLLAEIGERNFLFWRQ